MFEDLPESSTDSLKSELLELIKNYFRPDQYNVDDYCNTVAVYFTISHITDIDKYYEHHIVVNVDTFSIYYRKRYIEYSKAKNVVNYDIIKHNAKVFIEDAKRIIMLSVKEHS